MSEDSSGAVFRQGVGVRKRKNPGDTLGVEGTRCEVTKEEKRQCPTK